MPPKNKKQIIFSPYKRKAYKLSNLSEKNIVEFMETVDSIKENVSEDDDALSECSIPIAESTSSSLMNEQPEAEPSKPLRTTDQPRTKFKATKRPRSPLPEEGGPAVELWENFTEINPKSKKFQNIVWRKKHLELHSNRVVFRGDTKLTESYNELKTPYQCFTHFFTDKLFEIIAKETNLCAQQQDTQTKFCISCTEIRQYVGILIFMSVYHYPSAEAYWGEHAFEPIRSTMSSKQFFSIRKYIAFNNSALMKKKGEEGYDPLYQIRPVVDILNARFDSVPKQRRLCVDEKMCAMLKKTGVKLFVLCDSYGFSYKFEVYHDAEDNMMLPNTFDIDATSNVVVRLSQTIPNFKNRILYFDHSYTSLPLLVYLRSRGIYSLGTRIPNCNLPTDKDKKLAQKKIGYSEEYVGTAFGIEMSTVLWKDTKIVRMVSTYVGVNPFRSANHDSESLKTTRYDMQKKEYIEIDSPNIIKERNYHMEGVNHMNELLRRYHIHLKTNSSSLRLFYHLIDLAMVNAYLLHQRIHGTTVELPHFRSEVANVLCRFQQRAEKKAADRSSQSTPKATVSKRTYAPPLDVRYDGIGHMIDMLDRSGKRVCKLPGCKSETQIICTKCNLNLCLTTTNKCFQIFHTK